VFFAMSFKALFAAVAILLGAGPILILAPIVAPAFAQGARPAAPPPASSLIDLNSASRDDLMSLDGIGEVRADAIIRARPFKAKTELVERRLIPEALYEKIADKVMARPPPAAPPARPAQPAPRRT
jgi:competence protein ComEA